MGSNQLNAEKKRRAYMRYVKNYLEENMHILSALGYQSLSFFISRQRNFKSVIKNTNDQKKIYNAFNNKTIPETETLNELARAFKIPVKYEKFDNELAKKNVQYSQFLIETPNEILNDSHSTIDEIYAVHPLAASDNSQKRLSKIFGFTLKTNRQSLGLEIKDIISKVKDLGTLADIFADEKWYEKIENGNVLVKLSDIPILAKLYSIEPSLLQGLAPMQENRIIHLEYKTDYESSTLVQEEVRDTFHQIARMKLLGSKNIILKTLIKKGGKSIIHQHSGEEIILVIKGELTLVFPELTGYNKNLTLRVDDLVHFDSGLLHQIVNNGKVDAECITVRLHD